MFLRKTRLLRLHRWNCVPFYNFCRSSTGPYPIKFQRLNQKNWKTRVYLVILTLFFLLQQLIPLQKFDWLNNRPWTPVPVRKKSLRSKKSSFHSNQLQSFARRNLKKFDRIRKNHQLSYKWKKKKKNRLLETLEKSGFRILEWYK